MERDILAEVNHPFIVKLHYGMSVQQLVLLFFCLSICMSVCLPACLSVNICFNWFHGKSFNLPTHRICITHTVCGLQCDFMCEVYICYLLLIII